MSFEVFNIQAKLSSLMQLPYTKYLSTSTFNFLINKFTPSDFRCFIVIHSSSSDKKSPIGFCRPSYFPTQSANVDSSKVMSRQLGALVDDETGLDIRILRPQIKA